MGLTPGGNLEAVELEANRARIAQEKEKRPHAFESFKDSNGGEVIIQRLFPGVPDVGDVHFMCYTEHGPRLVAAYGAVINSGKFSDLTKLNQEDIDALVQTPPVEKKDPKDLLWTAFPNSVKQFDGPLYFLNPTQAQYDEFMSSQSALMEERLDQSEAHFLGKNPSEAEKRANNIKAYMTELSGLIGGEDKNDKLWAKKITEYATILATLDIIRSNPTDSKQNQRKLVELNDTIISLDTGFPKLN